jgi:AraC-like DNA-binding protein
VRIGELAAQALDGMMKSRKAAPPCRVILVGPADIAERASTHAVPPAGHLIQEALRYIRANVSSGLSASDVVRHLKVSPSLARARFAEVTGKSIRDTILDLRLALAEKQLRTTSEPIARIAKSCGFPSACRLAHFFQERHGCSPTNYRKSAVSFPSSRQHHQQLRDKIPSHSDLPPGRASVTDDIGRRMPAERLHRLVKLLDC